MKIISLGFATCFAISLASTLALAKTELTVMNDDCLKFSYQATQQIHDVNYRDRANLTSRRVLRGAQTTTRRQKYSSSQ
jgi:hypothetical protein